MDTKRLAKFLIITFVITGIAWSGLAVLTSLNIIPFSHPLGTILHIIGGFGPTIATFFVLEEKNTVKSILDFIFGYRKKSLIFLCLFSIFLSVSCYTELLAGDNLQKNEMCFCL